MIQFQESGTDVTFPVRVHPRAKKNAITGELEGTLKLSLTSPPVDGRANEACVAFLAGILNLPRSSITIASGQSSRNKVVRVNGLTAAEIQRRLQQD